MSDAPQDASHEAPHNSDQPGQTVSLASHHPGLEPKAAPAVRWWAVILGIALLALAFVAGREVWVASSDQPQQSWTQWFINTMATPGVQDWMLYAGAGAILVGLIFIFVACKPRRSTHMDFSTAETSMWLRPVDVARKASAAARSVPGVAAARTQATAKAVNVTINGDSDDPTLEQRTTEALERSLAGLNPAPKLNLTVEQVQEADTHV